MAFRLDRRKSRDGQTRAKLTPPLADAFFHEVLRQRLDQEITACAGDLRAMHDCMAADAAAVPLPRRVIAG